MNTVGELAAAARAGDIEAYGALIQRFQPMAHTVAYRRLGDHHLAQDLVQEAAIEAFLCLPQLREPAAFPGWFRQIVWRQCTRVLRQSRADCLSLDAGSAESLGLVAQSTPEEVALRDEIWTQVRWAVAALPRHERLVAALFYGGGYSYREVSASLGLPITTVKKRLHSARHKLRGRLQATLGDDIAPRSGDGAEIDGAEIDGGEIDGGEIAAAVALILLMRRWTRAMRAMGARGMIRVAGAAGWIGGAGREDVHPAAA